MEAQSRIVLRRSSEWINRLRSFKVIIDGQQLGSIANGATSDFRLSPGKHLVQCKVDWCGSRAFEVDLKEGENAYLLVKNGMKYYMQIVLPLFVLIGLNLYFSFSGTPKPAWFNYLLIAVALPSLAYILYYTLISRNDYLQITKDEKTGFA